MSYLTWITYTELTKWRTECFKHYGSILNLQVIPSPYSEIIRLYDGGKVLDVGAGKEKQLQRELKIDDSCYFTMDTDSDGSFDYATFRDVPGDVRFDYIVMNQFLEHLTLDDLRDVLSGAFDALLPGGCLYVSVPNAAHPVRYHGALTHVTNLPFNELYGVLKHFGYNVADMLRSNKQPFPRNVIKRWIVNVVCREFRVDWCDTIIIVANKD